MWEVWGTLLRSGFVLAFMEMGMGVGVDGG